MKILKIFEDEAKVYNGNCYVNTVIFKGRIYGEFRDAGEDGIKFSLKISNGKDEKTGEWRTPEFAGCTAFREVAKQILREYKAGDEIWILAKYYSKQHEDKYYKGFIVREVIKKQEANGKIRTNNSKTNYNKTKSNVDKNNNNSEDFNEDDLPF